MNREISLISESMNVQLADRVRALELQGRKIIKLQTGDPDFSTPKLVVEAALASIANGDTHYCSSRGLSDLRACVAQKVQRSNKFTVNPEHNILITHGASHGIYLALSSVINPGDEVIVISPYWMPYVSDILIAGGVPTFLETHIEDKFLPSADKLTKLIGPKTKALITNSPNNPTGAVYSRELLLELGRLCLEHGIYIISDEVYEDLIFDVEHISMQSLFPDYDKIISIFSFSKSYAMTGWRLGYLTASEEVTAHIAKLNQYTVTSLSPFVQKGGLVALTSEGVEADLKRMRTEYHARRDFIVDYLKDSPVLKRISIPEGAFYLFVDIKGVAENSSAFVWGLIEKHGVSFSPGAAFGPSADRYIRMTFAADRAAIKSGLDVLKEVFN